jgi:hypothetical protein
MAVGCKGEDKPMARSISGAIKPEASPADVVRFGIGAAQAVTNDHALDQGDHGAGWVYRQVKGV